MDPVATVEATEIELVAKTGTAEVGARARAVHMQQVSTASGLMQIDSQIVFERELDGCHGPSSNAHRGNWTLSRPYNTVIT